MKSNTQIATEIRRQIEYLEGVTANRAQRIAAGETDYDDCWRSAKGTNVSLQVLRNNLELAESEKGFSTVVKVTDVRYTHLDFSEDGEVRAGKYGDYIMFKEGDRVLFCGLSPKAMKGKGVVEVVTSRTVETLQEWISGYNPHSLTGMGYPMLVNHETCEEEHFECMRWTVEETVYFED